MEAALKIPRNIALELMEINLKTKEPILDLGNCGLTDESILELKQLSDFTHLKIINLGSYYYINGESVQSNNEGESNKLEFIPTFFPSNLLELYANLIGIVDLEGLNNYKELQIFDGYGNKIEGIHFVKLNLNLHSFGLSSNLLSTPSCLINIGGPFPFPNLKKLYLGKNSLTDANLVGFNELENLEVLHIYNNRIALKNNSLQFKKLKKLYAQLNRIDENASTTLLNMDNIEVLDIKSNPISKLFGEKIIESKRAVHIRAILNKVSLPTQLINECILKKNIFLDLGNCGLNDNSKELDLLKDCASLNKLSLGISYYNDDDIEVSSQNDLIKNFFTKIPKNLPSSITELQIRNSTIDEISNISQLTNLYLLELSFNEIKAITNISTLNKLHELALHDNKISKLKAVKFPASLSIIHLSSNNLTSLSGIENCKELEQLIVYGNNIDEISQIIHLEKLKTINLFNNPISDCPSEIWTTMDVDQIKAYFKERNITILANKESINKNRLQLKQILVNQTFSNKLNEDIKNKRLDIANNFNDVKLIILGNSNAGKTNLVHFLKEGTFLKTRNSTHGLEVKRWRPNVARFPQLKDVEVSIWDFGGQEYYHDAYKLFLGTDAVHVIVWEIDSDKNFSKDELVNDGQPPVKIDFFEKRYWLDTLKYLKGVDKNTPVVLVQNKVDDDAKKKRISQELHDEYGIAESFQISLLNGCDINNKTAYKNLENFSNYLADALLQVIANKAQQSNDFKKVRAEILKLHDEKPSIFSAIAKDKTHVLRNDFLNICSSWKDISANDYTYYPHWLSAGGCLVYFDKNEKLKEHVFLNPKKLSSDIYKILNTEVLNNKGELCIDNFKKNTVHEEDDDEILLEAMKNLELIYPHPLKPDTHYLVPQYLPEEHPIEDLFKIASSNAWQDSFWIRVPMFFYKKLMHYLLMHFIAEKDTLKYFWKNGIILIKNSKKILIKGLYPLNSDEGKIQVSVEEGNAALQKEIFALILKYKPNKVEGNIETTNTKATTEQNRQAENAFISKLEVSLNNISFVAYSDLLSLSTKAGEDVNNLLVKYKHLVPFTVEGAEPKKIFVSYAHNNTVWLGKIKSHLSGLRRKNLIKDWTDQEIQAGEKWNEKIIDELKKADIVILLLSADFIASDYIWEVELKKVLDNRKTIIPIYIESCDLAAIPNFNGTEEKISNFEIIPKDENGKLRPINLWANEAEALTKVASRIREVVERSIGD
jgi:internalin A